MHSMITLSLGLNLLVLVPVCTGLMTDAAWARSSYGPASPARGILLSLYLSLALVSAWVLLFPDSHATVALLAVQIFYKLTTPLTVRTLRNPVVLSNLGIALFHGTTLLMMT